MTGPLTQPAVLTADRTAVVAEVRGLVVGLGWPLGSILIAFRRGGAGRASSTGSRVMGAGAPGS